MIIRPPAAPGSKTMTPSGESGQESVMAGGHMLRLRWREQPAGAAGQERHDAAREPWFITGAYQSVTDSADGPWRGRLPFEEAAPRIPDLQRRHAIAVAAGR